MTVKEVLAELEAKGTEQNRKIYRRHGVEDENLFGVSYANLDRLAKQIRKLKATDIAIPLWQNSNNHDAKILASKILEAKTITPKIADDLAKEVTHSLQSTGLASVLAQTDFAPAKAEKWTAMSASRSHWKVHLGWAIIASIAIAKKTHKELQDSWFHNFLSTIEKAIHDSPNEIRAQMNQTLIAIGSRNESLRDRALSSAKKIGKVDVDQGETSCKTPDAASYIDKVWAKRAK